MGSQQVGTQKKLAENLTPCLNDELRLFPLFPFQKLLWPSRIFRAGSETHVCLLLRLPISLNKGTFPFPTKFSLLSIGFFFFFFGCTGSTLLCTEATPVPVGRLLITVASLIAEHRLSACGLQHIG